MSGQVVISDVTPPQSAPLGVSRPISTAPPALDLADQPAYDSLPAQGPIAGMMSPQYPHFGGHAKDDENHLGDGDISEMSRKDGGLCHCAARFVASGEKEEEGSGGNIEQAKKEKEKQE